MIKSDDFSLYVGPQIREQQNEMERGAQKRNLDRAQANGSIGGNETRTVTLRACGAAGFVLPVMNERLLHRFASRYDETAKRIKEALEEQIEPITAAALARLLKLSVPTVRNHLLFDGFASWSESKRPRLYWRKTTR